MAWCVQPTNVKIITHIPIFNVASQAKHWHFLKGFLPPFAEEALVSYHS